MSATSKKEFKIGLCFIIALVILYFGIEYLKGHKMFSKGQSYYAVYEDVQGLQSTANVSLSGVKVGQVSDVSLDPANPSRVIVKFNIDTDVKLPVGSAAMVSKDLLGTTTLVINLAQGTTYYASGDTVKSAIESGLMSQVSDMMPEVSKVFSKVDTLFTNLNNVVGNQSLVNTIENLDQLTSGLKGTVNNLNATTRALPGMTTQVSSLIARIDTIAADLSAVSNTIASAPLDSTLAHFNEISANLNDLTAQLKDPDSSLGQLINSPVLFDNLRNVTADIDSLIVDIKRNPKRYISIKLL